MKRTVRIRVLDGALEDREFIVDASEQPADKFVPFEIVEGRAFFPDSTEQAADVLDEVSLLDRDIEDTDGEEETEAGALEEFASESAESDDTDPEPDDADAEPDGSPPEGGAVPFPVEPDVDD